MRLYRLTVTVLFALLCATVPAVAFAQAPLEGTTIGETATDPTLVQYWTLVTGFFLPPVIAIVQKSTYTPQIQASIMFVIVLVVTLVQCWLYGQLNTFMDPAMAVLLVLVTTITSYKGLWKPLGVAPRIEATVNP